MHNRSITGKKIMGFLWYAVQIFCAVVVLLLLFLFLFQGSYSYKIDLNNLAENFSFSHSIKDSGGRERNSIDYKEIISCEHQDVCIADIEFGKKTGEMNFSGKITFSGTSLAASENSHIEFHFIPAAIFFPGQIIMRVKGGGFNIKIPFIGEELKDFTEKKYNFTKNLSSLKENHKKKKNTKNNSLFKQEVISEKIQDVSSQIGADSIPNLFINNLNKRFFAILCYFFDLFSGVIEVSLERVKISFGDNIKASQSIKKTGKDIIPHSVNSALDNLFFTKILFHLSASNLHIKNVNLQVEDKDNHQLLNQQTLDYPSSKDAIIKGNINFDDHSMLKIDIQGEGLSFTLLNSHIFGEKTDNIYFKGLFNLDLKLFYHLSQSNTDSGAVVVRNMFPDKAQLDSGDKYYKKANINDDTGNFHEKSDKKESNKISHNISNTFSHLALRNIISSHLKIESDGLKIRGDNLKEDIDTFPFSTSFVCEQSCGLIEGKVLFRDGGAGGGVEIADLGFELDLTKRQIFGRIDTKSKRVRNRLGPRIVDDNYTVKNSARSLKSGIIVSESGERYNKFYDQIIDKDKIQDENNIDVSDLLAIWPAKLFPDLRLWIYENVKSSILGSGNFWGDFNQRKYKMKLILRDNEVLFSDDIPSVRAPLLSFNAEDNLVNITASSASASRNGHAVAISNLQVRIYDLEKDIPHLSASGEVVDEARNLASLFEIGGYAVEEGDVQGDTDYTEFLKLNSSNDLRIKSGKFSGNFQISTPIKDNLSSTDIKVHANGLIKDFLFVKNLHLNEKITGSLGENTHFTSNKVEFIMLNDHLLFRANHFLLGGNINLNDVEANFYIEKFCDKKQQEDFKKKERKNNYFRDLFYNKGYSKNYDIAFKSSIPSPIVKKIIPSLADFVGSQKRGDVISLDYLYENYKKSCDSGEKKEEIGSYNKKYAEKISFALNIPNLGGDIIGNSDSGVNIRAQFHNGEKRANSGKEYVVDSNQGEKKNFFPSEDTWWIDYFSLSSEKFNISGQGIVDLQQRFLEFTPHFKNQLGITDSSSNLLPNDSTKIFNNGLSDISTKDHFQFRLPKNPIVPFSKSVIINGIEVVAGNSVNTFIDNRTYGFTSSMVISANFASIPSKIFIHIPYLDLSGVNFKELLKKISDAKSQKREPLIIEAREEINTNFLTNLDLILTADFIKGHANKNFSNFFFKLKSDNKKKIKMILLDSNLSDALVENKELIKNEEEFVISNDKRGNVSVIPRIIDTTSGNNKESIIERSSKEILGMDDQIITIGDIIIPDLSKIADVGYINLFYSPQNFSLVSNNLAHIAQFAGISQDISRGRIETKLEMEESGIVCSGFIETDRLDWVNAPAASNILKLVSISSIFSSLNQIVSGKGLRLDSGNCIVRYDIETENTEFKNCIISGPSLYSDFDAWYNLGSGETYIEGIITPHHLFHSITLTIGIFFPQLKKIILHRNKNIKNFIYERHADGKSNFTFRPLSMIVPGFFGGLFNIRRVDSEIIVPLGKKLEVKGYDKHFD